VQVAVVCTSILALMIFLLGFLISMLRGKTGIIYYGGSLDDPTSPLTKAVRALGNTAEFAPIMAVLFLYLGTTQPPGWVCWAMVIATVSRVLMVVGFLAGDCVGHSQCHDFIGFGGDGGALDCRADDKTGREGELAGDGKRFAARSKNQCSPIIYSGDGLVVESQRGCTQYRRIHCCGSGTVH
jgi:hypothetical protein